MTDIKSYPYPGEKFLLTEYGEVCNNIRWLADVRFKLLGLIPLATIFGAWLAVSNDYLSMLLISLFGLAITSSLFIYNKRNDQLYSELIGRAKDIEQVLGLYDGQFSHRSSPWLTLLGVNINHSTAVHLIYQASITVWIFGIIFPIFQFIFNTFNITQPIFKATNLSLIALLAACTAIVVVWLMFVYLQRKENGRETQIRSDSKEAMRIIVEELSLHYATKDNEKWEHVLQYLSKIKGEKIEKIEDFERTGEPKLMFYKNEMIESSTSISKPLISEVKQASYLCARLTGFPASWFEKQYLMDLAARERENNSE